MSTTIAIDTPDGPMRLYASAPDGPPRRGVVVIQEAFGVTPHIASVADRLAGEGYLAVVPHLFHRTGDPVIAYGDMATVMPSIREHTSALTAEGLAGDLDAAFSQLRSEGLADAELAVVGFCMGGAVAFATAARLRVGAAASFYGGGILEGRFGQPPLLELAPGLSTPWIGFYGDLDQGIPVDQVKALAEAASRAEVPTALHRYPDAAHGFNCDDRDSYHAPSAGDAWGRMLDWFAFHIAAPDGLARR